MDKINEVLTRGVEKIYPSRQALEKVLRQGKKLRVYQGFDPSMPSLHLGNTVGLLKLRQFQALGHKVIFLIGDFTGMIGDPTDKTAARPRLTRSQVLENCRNWQKQASKILSFSGKNQAELAFNSTWLDRLTFKDLIEITSCFTVQQMLERDFFQKRLKEKKPIYLHEFLYPVAQAIDSLKLDVDLEIGGSDQTFNMLVGRTYLKVAKKKEKFVLTTKLLVDAKGEKVGKTAGNALFLNVSPNDLFGGVMSFPDEVITSGFELLTQVPFQEIEKIKKEVKTSPMEQKKRLAFEIVKIHHGQKKAQQAQKDFKVKFQERKIPSRIPTLKIRLKKGVLLAEALYQLKLCPSKSEAKRLLKQGAVEINQRKIQDPNQKITLKVDDVIKVGKRKIVKLK